MVRAMTPTTLLIGVSGFARSGKDTAAAALVALGWEQRSFAAKLKAFLYAQNPPIPMPDGTGFLRLKPLVDSIGWERAKDEHPEVRALLQRTGTEAGRRVLYEDVWVDAALRCLGETPVVLADCRFQNEADAIRDRGGLVLRVNRPGVGPATNAAGEVHTSETALDGYDFDHVIDNSGSVEDLHRVMRAITRLP